LGIFHVPKPNSGIENLDMMMKINENDEKNTKY